MVNKVVGQVAVTLTIQRLVQNLALGNNNVVIEQ